MPVTALAAAGSIAAVSAFRNNPEVAGLVMHARDVNSVGEYIYHSFTSAFIAPDVAKDVFGHDSLAFDTTLLATETGLAFWLNERRKGIRNTLMVAGASQAVGCLATSLVIHSGMIERPISSDSGSSSAVVGVIGNWLNDLTEKAQTTRQRIGLVATNAALGLSVTGGNMLVERGGNGVRDAVAHGAPWLLINAYWAGKTLLRKFQSNDNAATETFVPTVENS